MNYLGKVVANMTGTSNQPDLQTEIKKRDKAIRELKEEIIRTKNQKQFVSKSFEELQKRWETLNVAVQGQNNLFKRSAQFYVNEMEKISGATLEAIISGVLERLAESIGEQFDQEQLISVLEIDFSYKNAFLDHLGKIYDLTKEHIRNQDKNGQQVVRLTNLLLAKDSQISEITNLNETSLKNLTLDWSAKLNDKIQQFKIVKDQKDKLIQQLSQGLKLKAIENEQIKSILSKSKNAEAQLKLQMQKNQKKLYEQCELTKISNSKNIQLCQQAEEIKKQNLKLKSQIEELFKSVEQGKGHLTKISKSQNSNLKTIIEQVKFLRQQNINIKNMFGQLLQNDEKAKILFVQKFQLLLKQLPNLEQNKPQIENKSQETTVVNIEENSSQSSKDRRIEEDELKTRIEELQKMIEQKERKYLQVEESYSLFQKEKTELFQKAQFFKQRFNYELNFESIDSLFQQMKYIKENQLNNKNSIESLKIRQLEQTEINAELQTKIIELNDKIMNTNAQSTLNNQQINQKIQNLNLINSKLTSELTQMQQKERNLLKTFETTNKQLQQQRIKIKEELSDALLKLSDVQNELNNSQSQIKISKNERQDLLIQLEQKIKQINHLKDQNDNIKSNLQKLSLKIQKYQELKNVLEDRCLLKETALFEADEKMDTLKDQIEQLKRENNEKQQQIQNKSQTLKALNLSILEQTKKNDVDIQEKDALLFKVKQSQTVIQSLEVSVRELEQKCQNFEKKQIQHNRAKSEQQFELSKLNQKLKILQQGSNDLPVNMIKELQQKYLKEFQNKKKKIEQLQLNEQTHKKLVSDLSLEIKKISMLEQQLITKQQLVKNKQEDLKVIKDQLQGYIKIEKILKQDLNTSYLDLLKIKDLLEVEKNRVKQLQHLQLQLTNQNIKLKSELQQLFNTKIQLQNSAALKQQSLHEELKLKQSQQINLNQLLDEYRIKIQDLQKIRSELEHMLKQQKQKIELQREEHKKLIGIIQEQKISNRADTENHMQKLHNEFDDLKKLYEEVCNELKESSKILKNQDIQLVQKAQFLQQLSDKNKVFENQLNEAIKNNAEIKLQSQKLREQNIKLRDEIVCLNLNIENINNKNSELCLKNQDINSILIQERQEKQHLIRLKQKWQDNNSFQQNKIDQISQINQDLVKWKRQIQNQMKNRDLQKLKLDQSQQVLIDTQNKLAQRQDQIKQKQQQNIQIKRQKQINAQQIISLKNQTKLLNQDLFNAQIREKQMINSISELRQQLNAKINQFAENIQTINSKIQTTKQQLQISLKKNQAYQQNIEQLKSNLSVKTQQCDQFSLQIYQLSVKQEAKIKLIEKLENEVKTQLQLKEQALQDIKLIQEMNKDFELKTNQMEKRESELSKLAELRQYFEKRFNKTLSQQSILQASNQIKKLKEQIAGKILGIEQAKHQKDQMTTKYQQEKKKLGQTQYQLAKQKQKFSNLLNELKEREQKITLVQEQSKKIRLENLNNLNKLQEHEEKKKNEILELKAKNNKKELQISKMAEKINQNQSKISFYKKKLEDKDYQDKSKDQTLVNLNHQLDHYKNKMLEMSKKSIQQRQSFENQLNKMRNEIERVNIQSANLLKRELLSKQQSFKIQKQNQEQKYQTELKKIREQCDSIRRQKDQAEKDMLNVRTQLLEQKKNSVRATAKLNQLSNELNKFDTLQNYTNEVNQKMAIKDQQIKKLFSNIQGLKNTMLDLQQGIQTYQSMAQQKQMQVQTVREQLQRICSENETLKSELQKLAKFAKENAKYESKQILRSQMILHAQENKNESILPLKMVFLKYFQAGLSYENKIKAFNTLCEALSLNTQQMEAMNHYKRTRLMIDVNSSEKQKKQKQQSLENKFFEFLTSESH